MDVWLVTSSARDMMRVHSLLRQDGASAELSLALKCGHPDMAKCHEWRGYCLNEMGRSDEAL